MGIIINLDVVMARRKIGLTELSRKVDITMANLSVLKNNKAKAIRFSTLEAICQALDCQPGDIITYVRRKIPAFKTNSGQFPLFCGNQPVFRTAVFFLPLSQSLRHYFPFAGHSRLRMLPGCLQKTVCPHQKRKLVPFGHSHAYRYFHLPHRQSFYTLF